MSDRFTQPIVIVLALLAAYGLGALRAPAHADDSGRILDFLREIARAESGQTDALKQIARSAEKCAR